MATARIPGSAFAPVMWVPFDGRVVRETPNEVTIAPTEDEAIHITHLGDDVSVTTNTAGETVIAIRVGARYVSREILAGSQYHKRPPGLHTSVLCGLSESECIGGAEYCCNTNMCVGGCDGETRCPE